MSESNSSAPPETLIKLLERQHALVVELARMAERQGALIASGDSDALMALLAQRQQIMDQFQASQDSLTQLSENHSGWNSVDDEPRRRIGGLVDDITRRLAVVMERDEQAREELTANRDRLGAELSGLSTARQAQQAYVKSRALNNRFADRQG